MTPRAVRGRRSMQTWPAWPPLVRDPRTLRVEGSRLVLAGDQVGPVAGVGSSRLRDEPWGSLQRASSRSIKCASNARPSTARMTCQASGAGRHQPRPSGITGSGTGAWTGRRSPPPSGSSGQCTRFRRTPRWFPRSGSTGCLSSVNGRAGLRGTRWWITRWFEVAQVPDATECIIAASRWFA